jgi:hypothetical protein
VEGLSALVGPALIDRYSIEICCQSCFDHINKLPRDESIQASWARATAVVGRWRDEALAMSGQVSRSVHLNRALKWERMLPQLVMRKSTTKRNVISKRLRLFHNHQYEELLGWNMKDRTKARLAAAKGQTLRPPSPSTGPPEACVKKIWKQRMDWSCPSRYQIRWTCGYGSPGDRRRHRASLPSPRRKTAPHSC